MGEVHIESLRALIDRVPRVRLANLPTPLEELPNLSRKLNGPRIFIKRDDLTGLAFGGRTGYPPDGVRDELSNLRPALPVESPV